MERGEYFAMEMVRLAGLEPTTGKSRADFKCNHFMYSWPIFGRNVHFCALKKIKTLH